MSTLQALSMVSCHDSGHSELVVMEIQECVGRGGRPLTAAMGHVGVVSQMYTRANVHPSTERPCPFETLSLAHLFQNAHVAGLALACPNVYCDSGIFSNSSCHDGSYASNGFIAHARTQL